MFDSLLQMEIGTWRYRRPFRSFPRKQLASLLATLSRTSTWVKSWEIASLWMRVQITTLISLSCYSTEQACTRKPSYSAITLRVRTCASLVMRFTRNVKSSMEDASHNRKWQILLLMPDQWRWVSMIFAVKLLFTWWQGVISCSKVIFSSSTSSRTISITGYGST